MIDVSFVIATRGDFYGGDNIKKTAKLVTRLKRLSILTNVASEFLIVDYNVSDKKLVDYCQWPSGTTIVEVPKQYSRLKDGYYFSEYLAKNIGIRRALGNQICILNNDVWLSRKAFLSCFNRPHLDSSFVRANRLDVGKVWKILPLLVRINVRHENSMSRISFTPLQLIRNMKGKDRVREKVLRRIFPGEEMRGSYILGPSGGIESAYLASAHTNAAGDFVCAPKWAWQSANGYSEDKYTESMGDGLLLAVFFRLNLRQVILTNVFSLIHKEHQRSVDYRKDWSHDDYIDWLTEFQLKLNTKEDSDKLNCDWGLGNVNLVTYTF